MKILSKEKTKALAERNGWPLARAEGFIDGEMFRRRGKAPSSYARVGIDEYSQGFRAGYYDRQNTERRSGVSGGGMSALSVVHASASRPADHAGTVPMEAGVVSIQGG